MEEKLLTRAVGQADRERDGFVNNELAPSELEVDIELRLGQLLPRKKKEQKTKTAADQRVQAPVERKNRPDRKRKSRSRHLFLERINDPKAQIIPLGERIHPAIPG